MEYASEEYKEAMQEHIRGKSYVWVTLDLDNIYAKDSAYISSSFTGDDSHLFDDVETSNIITSTENDGHITFTFGEYTSLDLSGATITFDSENIPSSITVTNGSTSKTMTDLEETTTVDKSFEGCSSLTITPSSGVLKIKKIRFGITLRFTHDEILNTSRSNAVKHLNEELPLKQYSFTVHNYDRLWNSDNPNGYSKYLNKKQLVKYYYGRELSDGSIYEILGGNVYLIDWHSDDYNARFSCVGLLDFTDSDYKMGRFYPDGITLYQLAEFVLIDAGITKYEIDAVLRTIKVTNPLPVDTHKACLQMIAHAGKCVLYEDRNGAVCLKSSDRPEILKTATLENATSYSAGYDVINPLTTANYGASEPDYTYADGLQYFFPESDASTEYLDTSVDYIGNTSFYAYRPVGDLDVVPVTSDSFSSDGLTIEKNGRTTTISGKATTPYGRNGSLIYYYTENLGGTFTIDPGTYRFTVNNNIEELWGSATTYRAQINLACNGENIHAMSYEDNRDIVLANQARITSIYIWCQENNPNKTITVVPHLYKYVKREETPSNTLPVGFVSEQYASANGTFTATPKINIKMESPCVLSEVVMNCAVAPKDFNINVTLDGRNVASKSITDNESAIVNESFNNVKCDTVSIAFTKTTPYQRIHVNNVDIVAKVDYEITYKDLTATPVASLIDPVSQMDIEIHTFTSSTDFGKSSALGHPAVTYKEIEGGGLWADINTGSGAIVGIEVKEGINNIELSSPSIVTDAQYDDDIEGGTVTITDSGAYFVTLLASRDGYVTLMGNEFMENVSVYSVPLNEIGNPVTVSNPLISTKEHADIIKEWLIEYYGNDVEYQLTYRGDPILDADDCVYLENQFVDDNYIRIESESLSTSGGMDTRNEIVARRVSYIKRVNTIGVTLNTTVLSLSKGAQYQLIATVLPSNARNKQVVWTSSNTDICTVDNQGIVIANNTDTGNCIITVTTVDGGFTATCSISVKPNASYYKYDIYGDNYPIDFIYAHSLPSLTTISSDFCTLISTMIYGAVAYNESIDQPGGINEFLDTVYTNDISENFKTITNGNLISVYSKNLMASGTSDITVNNTARRFTYFTSTSAQSRLFSYSPDNETKGYWLLDPKSGDICGQRYMRLNEAQSGSYMVNTAISGTIRTGLLIVCNILKTTKVYPEPVNGIYYIDYNNNEESIEINTLDIGSVIRDAPYGT